MTELTNSSEIAIKSDFSELEARVVAYHLEDVGAGVPTLELPYEPTRMVEIVPMPLAPDKGASGLKQGKRKGKGRHKQRW